MLIPYSYIWIRFRTEPQVRYDWTWHLHNSAEHITVPQKALEAL